MTNDRQNIRKCLKNYPKDTDKILLKDYLFNILSNITQSKSMLRRQHDERMFNNKMKIIRDIFNKRMNNKKVIKIPKEHLINFYNFNENSTVKNLIHSHSILVIPRKFISEKNAEQDILDLIVILSQIVAFMHFKISVKKRPNCAINYMTKSVSENNDRRTVF